MTASAGAEAFDESKYPSLKGQWERVGLPNWTPAGKPPFTPEYQAIYEANQADMRNGGAGNVPSQYCFPQGMPMMMNLRARHDAEPTLHPHGRRSDTCGAMHDEPLHRKSLSAADLMRKRAADQAAHAAERAGRKIALEIVSRWSEERSPLSF